MITKVNKALEIMMRNLRADKKNVNLEEARNIEDEINSLRDAIRSEHLQNVESGVYKIQSGMYYLDLIQSLEKIADLVYNISLALVKPL
jgi:phosphate:Na+ symporter